MLLKNLQLSVRRMRQSKLVSMVNILGMSISISSFLLIVNYLHHEISFDNFHKKADRIYRVESKIFEDNVLTDYWASTPFGCAAAMKNELSGIEELVRITVQRPQTENIVSTGNIHYREYECCYTEPSFFRIFSFPLQKGKPDHALSNPNTVVITRKMAAKYFGDDDPMGKILTFKTESNKYQCEVTGVLDNIPANSHLHFDFFISWSTLPQWIRDFWPIYGVYTYALMQPGVSPQAIEQQFASVSEKYTASSRINSKKLQLSMVPLRKIHFNPQKPYEKEQKGSLSNVYVLAVIALALLVIAWLNYINLSIALTSDRVKEYTIRKLSGARITNMVNIFFCDSFLTNIFAIILSIVAVIIFLPFFYQLIGQRIPFSIIREPLLWIGFIIVFATGIILTGFAPIGLLHRIKPSLLINGRGMPRENNWSHKILVCLQFTASIALIVVTITVFKQIHFMQNQSLGYESEQMLIIKFPGKTDNYMQKIDLFSKDVRTISTVQGSCLSGVIPGMEVANYIPVHRRGDENQKDQMLQFYPVDSGFISNYRLNILAGQTIPELFGNNKQKLVLNEEAVRYFGFDSAHEAIGHQLVVDTSLPMEIGGVVSNFHQQSFDKVLLPVVFVYQGTIPWLPSKFISVKIKGNPEQTVTDLSHKWDTFFPDSSFDYYFLDEFFNRQYQSDISFGKVFGVFTFLAIFIAGLGLFTLSLFSSYRKTKEIGIRKVNGARISEILAMLNKDFVKWVAIAFVLATPVAWYAMSKWLENFAYKTELSWWIFALAGMLALGIALLTVSWQSWKAATRNPVEALRYE